MKSWIKTRGQKREELALFLERAEKYELQLKKEEFCGILFYVIFENFHSQNFWKGTYRVCAPIYDPQSIWCVGLNYKDHCEEQGLEQPKVQSKTFRFTLYIPYIIFSKAIIL